MQSLSKEGQQVIAELRRKIHAHISRLPVAYYDATKTGTLVSRIMQDVEGVRNLLGTGSIDFAGGLLTSLVAVVVLLRINLLMTGLAVLFLGLFAIAIKRALKTMQPIFRERSKINAEVTGRLVQCSVRHSPGFVDAASFQASALLDKVPNLFQAFFSILEAGKSVPAHNGGYFGMIRYHLGLVVTSEDSPSIRIKHQFYPWKEGESVLFYDTWNHEVFNKSNGDRVVLLRCPFRRTC
jgi:hypothetical protein